MTYRLNLLVAALVTLVISAGAIETQAASRAGVENTGVAADLDQSHYCPFYTSDAADARSSVDLGGRRIIKQKKRTQ